MSDLQARDSVEFVRIGYFDACTDFTVGFWRGDCEDLKKAVGTVKAYNDFSSVRVNKAIDKVREALADKIQSYRFGREGSPVLYIIPYGEASEILDAVKIAFAGTRYDEFGVSREAVRIWWD